MSAAHTDLDALVVGAGFAGLAMQYRLREQGLNSRIVERGDGVGGTWYWNRYPGARCDIESVDYCYSFAPELLNEWQWSERFATQPEILAYLEFAAQRLDLIRDIDFGTTVTEAQFIDDHWDVFVAGEVHYRARFLIMATGNLSEPKPVDISGFETFEGTVYRTSNWPREGVDLTGLRVGVIGTGSTGIQAIPLIARQAAELTVFQRTPNYSMPAHNRPLSDQYRAQIHATFPARREMARNSDGGVPFPATRTSAFDVSEQERQRRYWQGWRRGGINALSHAFTDYFSNESANLTAQDFARARIREIVQDPQTAEALCPVHHIGTKRTCVDTDYYQTYNLPHVRLVDLRQEPLVSIDQQGVQTSLRRVDLDVLVLALGFDAMTGALLAINIQGRHGRSLVQEWSDGPHTYLGLMTAGFPNLFMITGPQSPGVLSNMVVSIEQHVELIGQLLSYLNDHGYECVEPQEEAQQHWVAYVNELADQTLYPQSKSWYTGFNVVGKPRVFLPYVNGCGNYRRECQEIVDDGWRGFVFTDSQGIEHQRV
ncbi:MAG: flavin-containing monooxygenase [Actinomycetales bacterium]